MIIGCVIILRKMIPKVRFRVCPLSEIAERIFSFRAELLYGANKEFPSVFIKIPTKIKEDIKKKTSLTPLLKKEIIKAIRKQMPPKRKLIYFKKNLENEWAKVNDVFFIEMKRLGFRFKQKYFDVGIIFGVCGHYDKNNKVYVTYANFKKEQFFYPAFVIAEEIFHLGYWDFFERIFKIKVKDPYEISFKEEKFSVWQISELLPEYYLKSHVFQKFNWHKFNRIKGYPWIREMKKISDPIFMRENNFKDFIILLHKECGCFPRKNLKSKNK